MVEYEEKNLKLIIWDTCGQERYNTLAKNMFKGTQGIILVYDISNRDTFLNIKKWSNHIKDSATMDVCVLLVGNKLDKENNREVSYDDGEKIAKECNFFFMEMSAKNNYNIKEGFEILVKEMYRTYGDKPKAEKIEVKVNHKVKKKNGKCC